MSLSKFFLNSCWTNDLEKVRECLDQGVDVNIVKELRSGEKKYSGLTIAAEKNYPELVDLLVSQPGIDVNLIPGYGTPLMYACYAGHHEIVRRLVQVPGINIGHKESDGRTALHYAANNGRSDCLKELAKVPCHSLE